MGWSSTGRRTLDHGWPDLCGTPDIRFRWGEPGEPGSTAAEPSSARPGPRWRDRGSADWRSADCPPGPACRALVHRRRRRVADCLRIPGTHTARQTWPPYFEQHDHRLRRRGRARRLLVSNGGAAARLSTTSYRGSGLAPPRGCREAAPNLNLLSFASSRPAQPPRLGYTDGKCVGNMRSASSSPSAGN
jgi:hypothetical protein